MPTIGLATVVLWLASCGQTTIAGVPLEEFCNLVGAEEMSDLTGLRADGPFRGSFESTYCRYNLTGDDGGQFTAVVSAHKEREIEDDATRRLDLSAEQVQSAQAGTAISTERGSIAKLGDRYYVIASLQGAGAQDIDRAAVTLQIAEGFRVAVDLSGDSDGPGDRGGGSVAGSFDLGDWEAFCRSNELAGLVDRTFADFEVAVHPATDPEPRVEVGESNGTTTWDCLFPVGVLRPDLPLDQATSTGRTVGFRLQAVDDASHEGWLNVPDTGATASSNATNQRRTNEEANTEVRIALVYWRTFDTGDPPGWSHGYGRQVMAELAELLPTGTPQF